MQTSGLLAVALNRQAAGHLSEQWRTRNVQKGYLALVHGVPEPRVGSIQLPLERIRTPRYNGDFPRMVVAPGGKPSLTSYRVLSSASSFSLVALTPHTGRMHQLRAHLDAIGHSILGDDVYGSPTIDFKPSRLCLHAAYLACTDPDSGVTWSISSLAPDFLQEATSHYPPFSTEINSLFSLKFHQDQALLSTFFPSTTTLLLSTNNEDNGTSSKNEVTLL
mmetsp:Transcript_9349/g.11480  ORF Transcript_9349/g.11480 Transcript_9349/m.11480 type:complete len:220 (-) Transcript_9349:773-1432(-)